jgi:FkbM family methyltransferase
MGKSKLMNMARSTLGRATAGRLMRILFAGAADSGESSPSANGSARILWLDDIQSSIKQSGTCTVQIQGCAVTFDMSQPHERAYAVRALMEVRYPQSDIDTAVLGVLIKEGDVVLDAGANIGMTALECLRFGARQVIAVEADPSLYERLATLEAPEIVPIAAAVSEEDGHAELLLSQTHNQGATLSAAHRERFSAVYGDDRKYIEVTTSKIDSLVRNYGPFDVWKLDIEGAEVDALKGAQHTLRNNPPRHIVAELFPHVFDQFVAAIAPTHPYAYRALLRKSDYQLVLNALHEAPSSDYCHTSPTFVFSAAPLLIQQHG